MLRLKSLRMLKGISRNDVAKQLDISVFTYRSWEQGSYEPSINNLIKLSSIFNVSIDHIVGNDEKRPI